MPSHDHPDSNIENALDVALEHQRIYALELGVLQPIQTEAWLVNDAGLTFELRKISSLKSKQTAQAAQTKRADFNPFADPDPALQLMDIAPHHRLLLNKFPVFKQHVLVVTRAFSAQTDPLDLDDFIALSHTLQQSGGLAFYNAGPQAGASQKHKHLQIIPQQALRQNQNGREQCCALAKLWRQQEQEKQRRQKRFASFDFAHFAMPFDQQTQNEFAQNKAPEVLAKRLMTRYLSGLEQLGLDSERPGPYNLCISQQGLLIVVRKQDEVLGISLNALAYAGFFLARDDEEIQIIRQHGPLNMLREAAG